MNDTKNDSMTQTNGDYAGPPKSHEFKSNTSASDTSTEAVSSEQILPEKTPENVQLDEEDILENPAQKNELLELIAEGDKPKEEKKKEMNFNLKFEVKELAKIREKIAQFQHQNKQLAVILNLIWIFSKVAFYCVGLSFFALSFFIYFAFEPLVHDYLKSKGLTNISFASMEHSLTEMTLNDVKDKNGLFTIGQIKVQYSFADLLEKKIPLVEISNMKLQIQEEAGAPNTTQALITTLLKLGVLDYNSIFSIQSLRLENSVLYVGNKEYKLPVSFSGIGSLSEKRHIVFPITLQNPYLTLKANLDLNMSYGMTTWGMEIISGALTLPGFDTEDLKGKAELKIRHGDMVSLNFLGTLTHEKVAKDVEIQLLPAPQGRFSAKITTTVPQKAGNTVYSFNISNINVEKDLNSFETRAPIFLKVSNVNNGNFKADAIQISANGLLKCSAKGCYYQMLKRSDLIFFAPRYVFYDTDFLITYPLRLTIEPSKDKTLSIANKKIDFDIAFNKTTFDLRKQINKQDPLNTNVVIDNSVFKGSYDIEKSNLSATLSTTIEKIDDSLALLSNGSLNMLYAEGGATVQLKANKARLKDMPYFKPEVQLDLTVTPDFYFSGALATENKQLALNLNGYYHPYTGEILMALQTQTPIVFNQNYATPYQLSSLFSPALKDVSGKVSLKGQVHYKALRSIGGPLQMSIDNLSFTYGNTKVKGLNTVLNMTQLVPFGAQGGQNIYARSISNILPFENISANVFFDANRKQFNISSMNTTLAGYLLYIDPMWYNYDAPVYNFTFKGKNTPVQSIIDGTTLKDLKIVGNGSISVSTQLENANFTLKNCELSIPNDGYIAYTPKTYANPFLENLKQLDFKKLSVYLSETEKGVEFIFSSDNKSNKLKKKTNFRFSIKEPLEKYILPTTFSTPTSILQEKENF